MSPIGPISPATTPVAAQLGLILWRKQMRTAVVLAALIFTTAAAGAAQPAETTTPATAEISQVKQSQQFGTRREDFRLADGHAGFVVLPPKAAADGAKPWIWYAPTFVGAKDALPDAEHDWLFGRLLRRHGHCRSGRGRIVRKSRRPRRLHRLPPRGGKALRAGPAGLPAAAEPRRADALQLGGRAHGLRPVHRRHLPGVRPGQLAGPGQVVAPPTA